MNLGQRYTGRMAAQWQRRSMGVRTSRSEHPGKAATTRRDFWLLALIYVNAFVSGAVVMAFEMLGSRYLNPYFGSGIHTWAALISSVLAALAIGYFIGGWLGDRFPRPALLGACIIAASVYMLCIPAVSGIALDVISGAIGDFRLGSIIAAMAILFAPLMVLGFYSPCAIRLVLLDTRNSGKVSGRVYGISTLGSIFGTLFTTFYLVPHMGTRSITYLLAAVALGVGLSFLVLDRHARSPAARAHPAE